MKILIIRHGDPDYSIDSLTETGWEEVKLLAQRLSKLDIKAFYCSPLGRAQDTARPTLEAMGRQAQTLPWLHEFEIKVIKPHKTTLGTAWDWLPKDWSAHPELYDKDQWGTHPIYAAGNVQAEAQKVAQGLDTLLASHGYVRNGQLYRAEDPNEDTIVLFCHFGVECVLLSHLLGLPLVPLWHGCCALPSSVTTVVTEEREKGIAAFRMLSFGDLSHLYAAGREPSFAARYCETYDNWQQRH